MFGVGYIMFAAILLATKGKILGFSVGGTGVDPRSGTLPLYLGQHAKGGAWVEHSVM